MAVCPYCAETIPTGVSVCPICHSDLTQPPRVGRTPSSRESDAVTRMLIPVDRSGWAIAAGYAGLFSLICFPAPIAIVLGLVAIRDIKRHPDRHGMGRAVFGLVMGIVGTGFLIFGIFGALMNR